MMCLSEWHKDQLLVVEAALLSFFLCIYRTLPELNILFIILYSQCIKPYYESCIYYPSHTLLSKCVCVILNRFSTILLK